MRERDVGDGNHDIVECVVLARGRTVHILSTAPTPKSIFTRDNMLVYDLADAQTVSMEQLLQAHIR